MQASYLELHETGELQRRAQSAVERLAHCTLCPRECGVNRLEGEKGFCETGRLARVSSYNAHFGEEEPLVGKNGSGTIFITSCNLLCVFCQNYEISHGGEGVEADDETISRIMAELQRVGCHNINFVTPTHVVPQILTALVGAVDLGLKVPLVYNSGGYDKVETLKLLDGVFDIYMPDLKFMDPELSERFCTAPDYPEVVKAAIKEMHRQTGDLAMDENGIAYRGLLVRHLVMPGGLAGTREAMRFLAKEVSPNTYVNVMSQYRPCGQAHRYPEIARALTSEDYRDAVRIATEEGITRLDERKLRFFQLLGL